MCKKMNLDSYFTSYSKFNSYWILFPKAKAKTIKLLKEKIEKTLCDLGLVKTLLRYDRLEKHDDKRKKRNKLYFIKVKNSYAPKDTIKKMEKQLT